MSRRPGPRAAGALRSSGPRSDIDTDTQGNLAPVVVAEDREGGCGSRCHLDAEQVNPAGSRVLVTGETVTRAVFGGSGHDAVFDSGVWAARRLAAAVAAAPR